MLKTKRLRKGLVFLLIFSMILSNFGFVFANDFSDITNHWAKSEIESWIEKGLIQGYEDGTFKPDKNITRAEFMTLINNAFGYTQEDVISYSDVPADAWFASQVAKAKAAGYISGYPDGTMKPNSPISRQEAASIIVRIMGLEENIKEANKFVDYNQIPDWSKGYIGAVLSANIMGGYPDGTFKAENPIKRAEAVVALGKTMIQSPNLEPEKEPQSKPEPESSLITYDKPGTYGPKEGIETISKNVVISSDGVILQNLIIKGDLTLDKKIGEGKVTLKNVTVEGNTYIRSVVKLEVTSESVIEVLTVDAAAEIVGTGKIKVAYVNVSGVSFEKMPDKVEKAKGVQIKIIGGASSGGGGGGGGYSPSPSPEVDPNTYNKPGTYGPETGIKTVDGNVIIKSKDVTIRNMKITGNLTLHSDIGNGEVTLKNVTVEGSTNVNGGGSNSIYFEDSVLKNVVVNKTTGEPVRIVAKGTTSVEEVKLQSSAIVAEIGLSGDAAGFGTVSLENTMPANSNVTLEGSFETVNTRAINVSIALGEGTNVGRLILDAIAQVVGTGTIRNATINANGSSLSTMPTEALTIPIGVTVEIEGVVHDDSSSFSPEDIAVERVTLNHESITLTVGGEPRTLVATLYPTNATDKAVTWSSSNPSVATVNNGVVTPIAQGTTTITVTTVDGGKTATSTVTVEAAPVTGNVEVISKQSLGMPTSEVKVNLNGAFIDVYTLYFDESPLATTQNGIVTVATEVLRDVSRVKVYFNDNFLDVTTVSFE